MFEDKDMAEKQQNVEDLLDFDPFGASKDTEKPSLVVTDNTDISGTDLQVNNDVPVTGDLLDLAFGEMSTENKHMDNLMDIDPFAKVAGNVMDLSPKSQATPETNTPPNSYMDKDSFDLAQHLPSFNSSEMVRRINLKKWTLSEQDGEDFETETNKIPFTPQNSYADEGYLIETSLPSFNSAQMVKKIKDKKETLLDIDEEDSQTSESDKFPFTPSNSFVGTGFESNETNLPSFHSSEMVKKIQIKKDTLSNDSENETSPLEAATFPFTPQNSVNDLSFPSIAKEQSLPSFYSSEMVRKVQEKRAELDEALGLSTEELQAVRLPFTPQNSFQENNFEFTAKEQNLPSFCNAETVEKIRMKRESLGGGDQTDEDMSYTMVPQNSFSESSMEKYNTKEDLKPFHEASLLQKVLDKRASIGGTNVAEIIPRETSVYPFTPQNSFSETSLDLIGKEQSLPSFLNAEMVERIREKRANIDPEGEKVTKDGKPSGNQSYRRKSSKSLALESTEIDFEKKVNEKRQSMTHEDSILSVTESMPSLEVNYPFTPPNSYIGSGLASRDSQTENSSDVETDDKDLSAGDESQGKENGPNENSVAYRIAQDMICDSGGVSDSSEITGNVVASKIAQDMLDSYHDSLEAEIFKRATFELAGELISQALDTFQPQWTEDTNLVTIDTANEINDAAVCTDSNASINKPLMDSDPIIDNEASNFTATTSLIGESADRSIDIVPNGEDGSGSKSDTMNNACSVETEYLSTMDLLSGQITLTDGLGADKEVAESESFSKFQEVTKDIDYFKSSEDGEETSNKVKEYIDDIVEKSCKIVQHDAAEAVYREMESSNELLLENKLQASVDMGTQEELNCNISRQESGLSVKGQEKRDQGCPESRDEINKTSDRSPAMKTSKCNESQNISNNRAPLKTVNGELDVLNMGDVRGQAEEGLGLNVVGETLDSPSSKVECTGADTQTSSHNTQVLDSEGTPAATENKTLTGNAGINGSALIDVNERNIAAAAVHVQDVEQSGKEQQLQACNIVNSVVNDAVNSYLSESESLEQINTSVTHELQQASDKKDNFREISDNLSKKLEHNGADIISDNKNGDKLPNNASLSPLDLNRNKLDKNFHVKSEDVTDEQNADLNSNNIDSSETNSDGKISFVHSENKREEIGSFIKDGNEEKNLAFVDCDHKLVLSPEAGLIPANSSNSTEQTRINPAHSDNQCMARTISSVTSKEKAINSSSQEDANIKDSMFIQSIVSQEKMKNSFPEIDSNNSQSDFKETSNNVVRTDLCRSEDPTLTSGSTSDDVCIFGSQNGSSNSDVTCNMVIAQQIVNNVVQGAVETCTEDILDSKEITSDKARPADLTSSQNIKENKSESGTFKSEVNTMGASESSDIGISSNDMRSDMGEDIKHNATNILNSQMDVLNSIDSDNKELLMADVIVNQALREAVKIYQEGSENLSENEPRSVSDMCSSDSISSPEVSQITTNVTQENNSDEKCKKVGQAENGFVLTDVEVADVIVSKAMSEATGIINDGTDTKGTDDQVCDMKAKPKKQRSRGVIFSDNIEKLSPGNSEVRPFDLTESTKSETVSDADHDQHSKNQEVLASGGANESDCLKDQTVVTSAGDEESDDLALAAADALVKDVLNEASEIYQKGIKEGQEVSKLCLSLFYFSKC